MEITKCEMIDTLVAVKVNLTLDWLLIQLSMQCIAKKNRHSQRKKAVFMELLFVRFPIRVSVWVNKNVLSLAGRYGQRAGCSTPSAVFLFMQTWDAKFSAGGHASFMALPFCCLCFFRTSAYIKMLFLT